MPPWRRGCFLTSTAPFGWPTNTGWPQSAREWSRWCCCTCAAQSTGAAGRPPGGGGSARWWSRPRPLPLGAGSRPRGGPSSGTALPRTTAIAALRWRTAQGRRPRRHRPRYRLPRCPRRQLLVSCRGDRLRCRLRRRRGRRRSQQWRQHRHVQLVPSRRRRRQRHPQAQVRVRSTAHRRRGRRRRTAWSIKSRTDAMPPHGRRPMKGCPPDSARCLLRALRRHCRPSTRRSRRRRRRRRRHLRCECRRLWCRSLRASRRHRAGAHLQRPRRCRLRRPRRCQKGRRRCPRRCRHRKTRRRCRCGSPRRRQLDFAAAWMRHPRRRLPRAPRSLPPQAEQQIQLGRMLSHCSCLVLLRLMVRDEQ